MTRHYRYIVIGRGLIGSAAGKYLAENADGVALVGPDEPEGGWAQHKGVFSSHYDEGRITRSIDPDRNWALFAGRSIARYRDMEARSGLRFYEEKGALITCPSRDSGSDYVANAERVAAELGLEVQAGDNEMLTRQFPFFQFDEGTEGVFEPRNAGYISPRKFVAAQNLLAEKAGAEIIRKVAVSVREQGGRGVVETADGETLTADRVLVAAGGFSIQEGLLPQPLEMTVYARTVVFFEVDEEEAARLSGMPSMINHAPNISESTYMLPPIQYPDGKFYLKIGGDPVDIAVEGGQAIADWFRNGPGPDVAKQLVARMKALVPSLKIRSTDAKPCVVSYAHSGYPMIGWTGSPHIAVATAGSGAAAKSSDEIGRLGAELLAEGVIMTRGYDAAFTPQFRIG